MVPPNQAELMVEALRRKGLPVAYLTFPGEQHGFRKAETIQTVLRAELAFYGRVFGFEPADGLADLVIDNLEHPRRKKAPARTPRRGCCRVDAASAQDTTDPTACTRTRHTSRAPSRPRRIA